MSQQHSRSSHRNDSPEDGDRSEGTAADVFDENATEARDENEETLADLYGDERDEMEEEEEEGENLFDDFMERWNT